MPVLITGSGMIGSHAAQWLVSNGERVTLFDSAPVAEYVRSVVGTTVPTMKGDIRELADIIAAIRAAGADRILHTAAVVGPGLEGRPFVGGRVNILGTLNVLEAARLLGLQTVVLCSTQSVYNFEVPCSEPTMDEEHPVDASGLYAASKLAGEALGATYHRTYGLNFIACRMATVYGPRLGVGDSRIGRMWNDMVELSLRGEPVTLEPPPFVFEPNDYVYVKDVAQALGRAVLSSSVKHRVFNVATGRLSVLADLVGIVEQAIPGARIAVKPPATSMAAGPTRRPYSLERIHEELGYVPEFDLARGLADQIAFTRGRTSRTRELSKVG